MKLWFIFSPPSLFLDSEAFPRILLKEIDEQQQFPAILSTWQKYEKIFSAIIPTLKNIGIFRKSVNCVGN